MFWRRKKFDPESLSERERERYGRNMIVKEWGGDEGQLALKRSTVLVVGAGGSGSSLLYYLAAAGVGTIRICDGDTVSRGNLNRQILYAEGSIGRKKAKEAARVLGRLNPDIVVKPYPEKLDGENADGLMKDAQIVCCAVDDRDAMRTIGTQAVKHRIPVTWAGGYYMGGFLTFVQPPVTPCMECMIEILNKCEAAIKSGEVPLRSDITLEVGGENPIVGAAAGTAGAMQAMETIKHLVGFGGSYLGIMVEFQMGGVGMRFNQYDIDQMRRKGCPFCNP